MRLLKLIAFMVLFCFTFLLFFPKQNLYFLVEKELKKYDIVISDEIFLSQFLGFELQDAFLYIKGVKVAKIDNAKISLFGIKISSKEIGNANTKININNKSIIVNFKPTKNFIVNYSLILQHLKKQKNGNYHYEYKFF